MILLLTVMFATPGYSQVAVDSSARNDSVSVDAKRFIDENGDGIDDRLNNKGKKLQRGKDRFIDKDGDGICDGRESGVGFRVGSAKGDSDKGGGRQLRGGRK